MSRYCLESGKKKYRAKMHALLTNMDRPVMARAYKCPHCGWWHITRKRPS